MAPRLHKTLVDYLVIAISPALIMTLIGSLVFFLIEVFYSGPFELRLKYVFALYVFAAVLVGRIAIEEGREHARLFAVPLAAAALVVLLRFVETAGPLNLILILVILWCADKLTWDCTVIDERQRDTGKGLLQVARPFGGTWSMPHRWEDGPTKDRDASDAEEPAAEKIEGVTSREAASTTWWKPPIRWGMLVPHRWGVERQRRPHTPGVWVVYFSLAALPLFGIGQGLIPATSLARRQVAFHLLVIYVASGLGLLLTTSFLGLRRYLRQRRVEMPLTMAGAWLTIGCVLIVALLLFAALLPRPAAEYAISRLPFTIGSPHQEPSRLAVGSDGVEADRGQPRSDEGDEDSEALASEGDEDAPPRHREGMRIPSRMAGRAGQSREHAGKSGKQKEGGRFEPGRKDGENQSQTDPGREPGESPEEPDNDSRAQSQRDSRAEESSAARDQARRSDRQSKSAGDSTDGPDGRLAPRPQPWMHNVTTEATALLKWVFYVAVVLVGVYCLWRYRAELLAALQGLLRGWREFLQNLFGRKRKDGHEAATAEDGPKQTLPRPFADFADPFASGAAGRYSPEELVRYSFEALEAWGREHSCPRRPEQTPHEFARDLGAHPALRARDVRSLADLYCQVAYAPSPPVEPESWPSEGSLRAGNLGPVRQLWQQLRPGGATATRTPRP